MSSAFTTMLSINYNLYFLPAIVSISMLSLIIVPIYFLPNFILHFPPTFDVIESFVISLLSHLKSITNPHLALSPFIYPHLHAFGIAGNISIIPV